MQGATDVALLSDEQLREETERLLEEDRLSRRRWFCPRPGCDGSPHPGWLHQHARAEQHPPAGAWRTWVLLPGRGWGKTRTANEWLLSQMRAIPGSQWAVVAKTDTLVRDVPFESNVSGLIHLVEKDEVASYTRGGGSIELRLTNGSMARGFSSEQPDNLRGWAFDGAVLDEYAAYPAKQAQDVIDQVWFTLREADNPRIVIATTPRAVPHVRRLVQQATKRPEAVRLVRGHTLDNRVNLSAVALEELADSYEGTRLGRQELGGELLDDVEGALWALWQLELDGFRVERGTALPEFRRVVVAVDPATTSKDTSDNTGYAVVGVDHGRDEAYADRRPHAWVLHSSEQRARPEPAMRRAVELYRQHKADAIVVEANQGGDYLPSVLRQVDPTVPVQLVHATRGKAVRAEPVSALYDQRRVHHVGARRDYAALEEQMTSWVPTEAKSPDALDALVWAMWGTILQQAVEGGKVADYRLRGRR